MTMIWCDDDMIWSYCDMMMIWYDDDVIWWCDVMWWWWCDMMMIWYDDDMMRMRMWYDDDMICLWYDMMMMWYADVVIWWRWWIFENSSRCWWWSTVKLIATLKHKLQTNCWSEVLKNVKTICYKILRKTVCYKILPKTICYKILPKTICYKILPKTICYKILPKTLLQEPAKKIFVKKFGQKHIITLSPRSALKFRSLEQCALHFGLLTHFEAIWSTFIISFGQIRR